MNDANPILPRFIGLCGNPKAGKSEVQKILEAEFGYRSIDDGHVLREFAVEKLGLTWDDVQTQAGKARRTEILGKTWVNRDILGTLGKQLEDMFGEWIMPFIATRGLSPHGFYSFGSVRKTQGHFFRKMGGVVIEVRRPDALPSPYEFDRFDTSAVSAVIDNDGDLELLRLKTIGAVNQVLSYEICA